MSDSDDRERVPDPDRRRTTDQPTKYPGRRDTDANTEKRSRYCKHGQVWGRCTYGC